MSDERVSDEWAKRYAKLDQPLVVRELAQDLLEARARIAALEGERNDAVRHHSKLASERGCRLSAILDMLLDSGVAAKFGPEIDDDAPVIEDAIRSVLAKFRAALAPQEPKP